MTPLERQTKAIKAVRQWVRDGKPCPRTWEWIR
jgi:hypothetical protein